MKRRRCRLCGGYGKVAIAAKTKDFKRTMQEVICPNCHGAKWVTEVTEEELKELAKQ